MATHDQWLAARESVRRVGARFADLVAAAADPDTMATPDWTVAQEAAHVAAIAWWYTELLPPGDGELKIPELDQGIAEVTVDTVADLNNVAFRYFTERDPQKVAERLRTDIDLILRGTEHHDPETPFPWLGGSTIPLAGVIAHLVNELLIHGRDIAQALHVPWPIDSRDAALFFELFIANVLRDFGKLVDSSSSIGKRPIAVEFRSRYTTPVVITLLNNGRITVEPPTGKFDMRIHFEPAALNLMLFGRISMLRTIATGKLIAWGPRPWLLPRFLSVVRLPSNSQPLSAAGSV